MKNGKPLSLFLIIFLFLAAHFVLIARPHVYEWDEAVYTAIGRNLFSSYTVGLFDEERPLALPFIYGLIWKAGLQMTFWGEIVTIAFSAALICLVYLIGAALFNRRAAFFASLMLAVTPVFFHYSSLFFTEIPSAFFAFLSITCLMKKRPLGAGISAGLAFLTKFPQALLFMSLFFTLITEAFIHRKSRESLLAALKDLLLISGGFVISILPFCIFNLIHYRDSDQSILYRCFHPVFSSLHMQNDPFEEVRGFWNSLLCYPCEAVKENPLLILSIGGFFILIARERLRDLRSRIVFIAFLITCSYFTSITTKDIRYLNIVLPYLSLLSGAAFSRLCSLYEKRAASLHFMMRNAVFSLSVLLFLAGINRALCGIEKSFIGRPLEEPAMIDEYGRFFSRNPAKGTILTCDPIPAAYCESLFVQYFSVDAAEREMRKEDTEYVIFTLSTFPEYFINRAFADRMNGFVDKLFRENRIVAQGEHYNGNKYYIVKLLKKDSH